MTIINITQALLALALLSLHAVQIGIAADLTDVHPMSDAQNVGEWIYNEDVSDEFEDDAVDEERWYIVGKFEDGKPVYKHPDLPQKNVWKGRAPSQFSGRNYRLEDGVLKLEVRWEPDFPFSDEIKVPTFGEALPYENITTPCFIGRRSFKYGYIETRSKAADAEISSAFWSTGDNLEFDFFEQFGDGRNKGKDHLDSQLWWSIRDWKTLKGKPAYTERKDLGFRVADAFHVYGVEWDEKGVKYYVDGKLFSSVSADEVRAWTRENREVEGSFDGWVATKPIHIWLDMETFSWHGMPDSKADLEQNSPAGEKDDGVVDFEIDYVRVWQNEGANNAPDLSERDRFFSFEEPIAVDGKSVQWWIPEDSRSMFSIVGERASSGNKALKLECAAEIPNRAVAFAPYGSTKIEPGEYTFSMKVWLEPNCNVRKLQVLLEDPWVELKPFELAKVEPGKWVTLERTFRRRDASGPKDRPRIIVKPEDVSGNGGTLFIDQVKIEKL